MKATKSQYETLASMFDRLLEHHGHRHEDLQSPVDLWRMFTLCMHQVSCREMPDESRRAIAYRDLPLRHGTHRDWLFNGLDDSHIKTMFKRYAPQCFQ